MSRNTNLQGVQQKIARLEKYLTKDVFEVIGTEAVNHFQDSFHNEGYTDKALKKWPDVKRRKAGSSWYGFKYGAKRNYSDAATKRPILSGETQELMNSISYRTISSRRRVQIFSNLPYAKIHNEGGSMKVFGKARTKMPKRQFMGKSAVMEKKIVKTIKSDIKQIMK